jgi:hypothetical protein
MPPTGATTKQIAVPMAIGLGLIVGVVLLGTRLGSSDEDDKKRLMDQAAGFFRNAADPSHGWNYLHPEVQKRIPPKDFAALLERTLPDQPAFEARSARLIDNHGRSDWSCEVEGELTGRSGRRPARVTLRQWSGNRRITDGEIVSLEHVSNFPGIEQIVVEGKPLWEAPQRP